MASACIRNMTLSQKNNINMIQQNCVIISTSQNYTSPVQHHQQSSTTANKMPAIAPAPPTHNNNNRNTNSILGMNSINMPTQQQQNQPIDSSAAIRAYKKKYTYANMPYGEQPPSVARRNARERNRVKQVNNGFANLRQHIPQTIITTLTNGGRGASKKLSKVDTLRMAVEYINRLQELITDTDSETSSNYNSTSNSSIGSPNVLHQYFPSSPDDTQHHSNFVMQSTSSYSEASVSPAPSCSSELSIGSNHHYGSFNGSVIQQQQQQQQHQQLQHQPQQQQFKYEPYDNYNSITDTTPEDEELLDYISSWQEQ